MATPMSTLCSILDGGLASQLVANGYSSLNSDPLWSARLLHTDQAAIQEAHREFTEAGADIIETNTYQVSLQGFRDYLHLSNPETLQYIKESVTHIAKPVVESYRRKTGKNVLIAGAIGPYGACLHDGSEYTGLYLDTMTEEQLIDWHRPRMNALAEAGVDMFAFETLPGTKEGKALVKLLENEFPRMDAWLSYSCKNGLYTNHGELLSDAVKCGVDCSQVTHVGVNCTSPEFIGSLLDSLQVYKERQQFIVYPNSGELWQSGSGWGGGSKLSDIQSFMRMCVEKGARIIGGCCQVTHKEIQDMRRTLDKVACK